MEPSAATRARLASSRRGRQLASELNPELIKNSNTDQLDTMLGLYMTFTTDMMKNLIDFKYLHRKSKEAFNSLITRLAITHRGRIETIIETGDVLLSTDPPQLTDDYRIIINLLKAEIDPSFVDTSSVSVSLAAPDSGGNIRKRKKRRYRRNKKKSKRKSNRRRRKSRRKSNKRRRK